MPFFPCAHAGHPVWQYAVRQVIVQLQAQTHMQACQTPKGLGIIYTSASYAPYVHDIVTMLAKELPGVQHWVGCTSHAVLAGDLDYGHSGALAVMLLGVPRSHYQVFSDVAPWNGAGLVAQTVLIHGDVVAHLPELRQQLVGACLIGGLCALRHEQMQWSWGAGTRNAMPMSIGGGGVQMGGVSGVSFGPEVECLTISMQGCKPVGSAHAITKVDEDVVLELDGRPALEVLFRHIDWESVAGQRPSDAQPWLDEVRSTLVAVLPPEASMQSDCLSTQARVMPVVGVDLLRQGVVLSGTPERGCALTLCQMDEQAILADMRRACAELWELLTTMEAQSSPVAKGVAPYGRSIGGAIYIRNYQRQALGRAPKVDAELRLIRHVLGPIPLMGFASAREIESGQLQHLSAQLLVFTQPLQALV